MRKRTNFAEQHISLDMQVSAIPGSVTRRQFLQALVAAGASVALPMPLAAASVEAINAAWQQAVERPWYFEVSEWGTIVEPGIQEPKTWADLYSLSAVRPRDTERLVGAVQGVYPLQSELQRHAEERREELALELDAVAGDSSRRVKLEQLIEDVDDPEWGWAAWIRQQGTDGIEAVWELVQQWLSQPVDWAQSDYFPADWHGTGRAYQFFRGMESELLEALGVEIVEGACPGSDYFAAELHLPIEEANAHAAERGLPFRFRPEEVRS